MYLFTLIKLPLLCPKEKWIKDYVFIIYMTDSKYNALSDIKNGFMIIK